MLNMNFYNKCMVYCTHHLQIYRDNANILTVLSTISYFYMLHMLAPNFCKPYVRTICAYIHEPVCAIYIYIYISHIFHWKIIIVYALTHFAIVCFNLHVKSMYRYAYLLGLTYSHNLGFLV